MSKQFLPLILLSFFLLLFSACEFNINTDDDCLECMYTYDAVNVTKEVCDALGTEDDKEAMRERMQIEADSIGVTMTCRKH